MDRIELFLDRVGPVVPFLQFISKGKPFYVAGGVFLEGDFGDIDVWGVTPPTTEPGIHIFDAPCILRHPGYTGCQYKCEVVTDNAVTYKVNDVKVQVCLQPVTDLKSLLETFDFAICQIGAKVSVPDKLEIEEFYATMHRYTAVKHRRLGYRGTNSPGISLLRAVKYIKRIPDLDLNTVRNEVLQIVIDLINKGVEDPEKAFGGPLWSETNEGRLSFVPELIHCLVKLQKIKILTAL